MAAGFSLPVILVVTGALFILAVGILLVAGLERGTARSFVDRERAKLAAQAGLEEVCAILNQETANDDYLVVQAALASTMEAGHEPAPQLFLVRGRAADCGGYSYRYVPLFSTVGMPAETPQLTQPNIEALIGSEAGERLDFTALPYQDKVGVAWQPVRDEQGRIVARYAYWVDDLQAKLDPHLTGNLAGPDQTHARAAWPFPAPGLNPVPQADGAVPLDQIALFAIDPATRSNNQGPLGKTLVSSRQLLISPGSLLAAAHVNPPLVRDPADGRLVDLTARAAEENLIAGLHPYFERPLIPFVLGIAPGLAGTPRMNLNALLAKPADEAVDAMAAMIRAALPDFDQRKGGFPEDYVKTLAANAIDYADEDSIPSLKANEYRGLDAYPLMSEIALKVSYLGIADVNDRKVMTFQFKLFAELCNPTSQEVSGDARLSYEVALPMDGIGSGVGGEPFDSPSLLDNPAISTHDLTRIGSLYWSHPVGVRLQPNQYRCYNFAEVTYSMDIGKSSDAIENSTPFSLNETESASGLSLMWNGAVVERTPRILRQQGLVFYRDKDHKIQSGFKVGEAKCITKAALPGYVYDDYPQMYYNMGDPRITHYLRGARLDENAYPENASPNRRNIRLGIYQNDTDDKPKVYARVQPSEWPDGGHNAAVGTWSPGTDDKTEMTDARFDFPYDPQMRFAAPQWISNAGRFYSVTELGRVFDPIMHAPTFASGADTAAFRSKGKMPGAGDSWPDVVGSEPSSFYGGGNTLRIGRPEHPAFDLSRGPGLHAAHLLDIFHAGLSRSEVAAEREGPLVRIEGHVNLNTASRDTLRAMAAGALVMDPLLARKLSDNHLGAPVMAPPTSPLSVATPTAVVEADRIADAIILARPFASTAGLAFVRESNGSAVFGNREMYPDAANIEWTDAAAEETFARVYEGATVRSRNLRVWVVAQALAPSLAPGAAPTVRAEVRKVHTLFADPGRRDADGAIISGNCRTQITSSNDF
jgi:hypothetical protein